MKTSHIYSRLIEKHKENIYSNKIQTTPFSKRMKMIIKMHMSVDNIDDIGLYADRGIKVSPCDVVEHPVELLGLQCNTTECNNRECNNRESNNSESNNRECNRVESNGSECCRMGESRDAECNSGEHNGM